MSLDDIIAKENKEALDLTLGQYLILREMHSYGNCTIVYLQKTLGRRFDIHAFNKLKRLHFIKKSTVDADAYHVSNECRDLLSLFRNFLGLNRI